MPEPQVLKLETIVGLKHILAPAGWQFDKTATSVWSRLLSLQRDGFKPFVTKRDRAVWEGQVHILALVLSNVLGMAPYYWEQTSLQFVIDERKAA